jgi:hypothetical protein
LPISKKSAAQSSADTELRVGALWLKDVLSDVLRKGILNNFWFLTPYIELTMLVQVLGGGPEHPQA